MLTLLAQPTRKLKKQKNNKKQTTKQKQKSKKKQTQKKKIELTKMKKNPKNKTSNLLYQMLKALLML